MSFPLPKEANFPDIEEVNQKQLIEKYFSQNIEGPFKEYLDKIRTVYKLTPSPNQKIGISQEVKNHLSVLIIIQFLRTKKFRNDAMALEQKVAQMLVDMIGKNEIADYNLGEVTVKVPENSSIAMQASMIFDPNIIQSFANELNKHCWIVLVNETDQPYFTSDNPVVIQEHKKHQFMSNTGIASEGVEVIIPVSPNLLLIMLEKTYHQDFLKFENQFLIVTDSDIVDGYNFLQVSQSNRQIYCSENKLGLLDEIKRKTPDVLKYGSKSELHFNGKVY